MITNAQAIAKKNILEAISIQIGEVEVELREAKKDLSSLRIKMLSAPHASVERELAASFFDVTQCEQKIRSLREAEKMIQIGFGG
jgi:septal ring factor EnvC (AmiA/AmiB activator)